MTVGKVKLVILVFCTCLIQVSCLMEWGNPRRSIAVDESERRRQLLAQARSILDEQDDYESCGSARVVLVGRRKLGVPGKRLQDENIDETRAIPSNYQDTALRSSDEKIFDVKLANRVTLWPPWPLNLLGRKKENKEDQDGVVTASNTYPSAAALFWTYFVQRTRIGVRQFQEVGSQLWFHLPPAAPPLILLASFPRKVVTENVEAGVALSKRVVPLISNPFARTLALSGLGLSLMSWAHMEVHRKRILTPLPLALSYQSVSRVFLPPFLPEEVSEPEIEALQSAEKSVEERSKESLEGNDNDDSNAISLVSPKLRKHLNHLYESAPRPRSFQAMYDEMKRVRAARRREAAKIHRLSIFDELVALQAIKRMSARNRKLKSDSLETDDHAEDGPGYALVTGASQGIGRAIAVELARWEIPLILVARDVDRLTSLAYDLEACYGVKCCVLKADLSQVDAAEKVHQTTKKAGIPVDILINNAGVAYEGLSVDMETTEVERMVMINAMTYAKLAKLYGRDMTTRGRGRMLMVSSMAGLTSASPNTGLYGATKAFGKSLAMSMAKELEPYGVGVTCLMPGPVSNTQFRLRSGTRQALCWYLPFYPRPAQTVAHLGVMSLLDGDTQAIPGWQNRVFVKILRPLLPQRVEAMAVQAAWSPLRLPRLGFSRRRQQEIGDKNDERQTRQPKKGSLEEDPSSSTGIHFDLRPRYKMQMPPRLLELPEPEPPAPEPVKPEPSESEPEPEPESEVLSEGVVDQRVEREEEDKGSATEQDDVVTESEKADATTESKHTADKAAQRSSPMGIATNGASEMQPDGVLNKPKVESKHDIEKEEVQEKGTQDADNHTDKACVGTKRRSEDRPKPSWNLDERLGLSPQLGPVDIMEHRNYELQKLEVIKQPIGMIQA